MVEESKKEAEAVVEESKKEAGAEQSVLEIIEKTDGKTLFEYTRFY